MGITEVYILLSWRMGADNSLWLAHRVSPWPTSVSRARLQRSDFGFPQ